MAKKQKASKAANRRFKEILGSVSASESSVFSKEDVIRLLEETNAAAESRPRMTDNQLTDLVTTIVSAIRDEDNGDLVEDYELTLDGSCIEVQEFILDYDRIEEIVGDAVAEWEEDI